MNKNVTDGFQTILRLLEEADIPSGQAGQTEVAQSFNLTVGLGTLSWAIEDQPPKAEIRLKIRIGEHGEVHVGIRTNGEEWELFYHNDDGGWQPSQSREALALHTIACNVFGKHFTTDVSNGEFGLNEPEEAIRTFLTHVAEVS